MLCLKTEQYTTVRNHDESRQWKEDTYGIFTRKNYEAQSQMKRDFVKCGQFYGVCGCSVALISQHSEEHLTVASSKEREMQYSRINYLLNDPESSPSSFQNRHTDVPFSNNSFLSHCCSGLPSCSYYVFH
jgi:hypothetical protein